MRLVHRRGSDDAQAGDAHSGSRCASACIAIGTVAAVYEIIEWIYAATQGGSAGAAFLGSQGDIWDAQEDMLADILGALFASTLFLLRAPSTLQGSLSQASSSAR